jgi:hypothetical protein
LGDRREQLVMDTKSSKGTLWSVGVLPAKRATRGPDAGASAGMGAHPDVSAADAAGHTSAGSAASPAGTPATSEWEGL